MSLIVDIKKRLGSFSLSAQLEAGEGVTGILGSSGCGKSMTLKCIAGIERPDSGHIELDGVVLYDSRKRIDLHPQQRRVGYLFQNYALFPNMMAFLHFFFQFFGFVCSCDFGTESNFDHIVETDLFDRCQYLPRSGIELSIDSRSRDSYDFFLRITNTFVYIDDFRPFHDSSIGTGLHTFSAIDTFIFIYMLGSVFAFGDRFHRANILARYGRVHDRVVRADFRT